MREDTIQAAIADWHTGRYKSLNALAKAYRLPRSTLTNRINGTQTRAQARITQQILSPDSEDLLVQWCLDLEKVKEAPTHAAIRDMASIISQLGGGPSHVGQNYVRRFLSRHPEVHTKSGVSMDYKRVNNITKQDVLKWFEALLDKIKLKGIKSHNMWNMDEVGTAFSVLGAQSVVGSSQTTNTLVTRPYDRSWITVIECVNPSGRSCKPLVIFKGKHVQEQWFIPSMTPDWAYTCSNAAFTTNEISLRWLQEIFVPEARRELSDNEWVLLLLDGHKSHIQQNFMLYAYTNKIWCHYLIPHASHILQPLDLTIFSSLKRKYRALVAIDSEISNYDQVKQQAFLTRYQKARTQAISPTNCASGFAAAGILPWNPSKAASSHFIKLSTLKPPTTPPSQVDVSSSISWDTTMTPLAGRHLRQAITELSRDQDLPRTARTVLHKSAKQLDRLNFNAAQSQREVRSLRQQLSNLRAKKSKKRAINPNLQFIELEDIKMGPHSYPPQLDTRNSPIIVPDDDQGPSDGISSVVNPLSTALSLLSRTAIAVRSIK